MRIYFNRRADAPCIWAFDYGTSDTETKVSDWMLHEGLRVANGQDQAVPVDDTERPRVWMEVYGVERVTVHNDIAQFYGATKGERR